MPQALKEDEKNIRRLLAEALRAHGRYYVSLVSDAITTEYWETRLYGQLDPNPESMHEDDLLEVIDYRPTEAEDVPSLALVRQPITSEAFPQFAALFKDDGGRAKVYYGMVDPSAHVALFHAEEASPHRGERFGTERDVFWLLIEDSSIKISGVAMRGTSQHSGNAFFFEDVIVYESSGRWSERLSEVLRIFRVCVAAEEECPLHNVQLHIREK